MGTKTNAVTVGTTPTRLDVAPDTDNPPGQQLTIYNAVTVGTTPTRLDVAPDTDNPPGQQLTIYNAGAVDVWLGGPTVTAGNGIRLAPGGVATEALPQRSDRWGVVASGTCQVNVDQVGV